jgi:hypothetical protein
MNSPKSIFITAVLTLSVCLSTSIQAKTVENTWTPFDIIIPGSPDCGNENDFFRLEGMEHLKVSTLRNGMYAVNIVTMGTLTQLGSDEGFIFQQNINDVFPILGENVVINFGQQVRVITKGKDPNLLVNINFHVTDVGGEIKSWINTERISCE